MGLYAIRPFQAKTPAVRAPEPEPTHWSALYVEWQAVSPGPGPSKTGAGFHEPLNTWERVL